VAFSQRESPAEKAERNWHDQPSSRLGDSELQGRWSSCSQLNQMLLALIDQCARLPEILKKKCFQQLTAVNQLSHLEHSQLLLDRFSEHDTGFFTNINLNCALWFPQ